MVKQIPTGTVYLIPAPLYDGALHVLPAQILPVIQQCNAFFVEHEKTTRRYFKQLWKEMDIDAYTWFTIHKAEEEVLAAFTTLLLAGKTIGIVSEAGCPGIADPGQILVAAAQQLQATIHPLVGPNAIIMALMASGMNGQRFAFEGYLPIDSVERKNKIKALENASRQHNSTQIFIETPYRNQALLQDLLQVCKENTLLCVGADITSATEVIVTKTIAQWKTTQLPLHKRPAIFLLYAG
ncbi:MAG: SAM-dependent methyltransferase [Bacteroidota bacterium]|uniref:SAM-dependent methyltransferase n=1 Tax=Hydrotalea sp. AMD TaxID=2501297 RepID=UPI0009450590|nr:SAM-dependent methyltransferase [Hydrotalea sp. AMD]MDE3126336.1 SAM-dependent methyltransferase [Bacteroidota bacterium]RWZ84340.1 MAG: SAM-dependent methyltransferase [Hydrotalea sp. AMD]